MTAKKMIESNDADPYAHVAVNGKKSAGIVSGTVSNRSIDAGGIRQERGEIRPRNSREVMFA